MLYPKYPENEAEALQYAKQLSKLHGKPWIAIKRINLIKNKFAFNFVVINSHEMEDYAEQWKKI
jgi:hypothetical protein